MTSGPVVEICIKQDRAGQYALYRVAGTRSLAWHYVGVKAAQRALEQGRFLGLRAVKVETTS